MNKKRSRIEISGLNNLDLAQLQEELQHSGLSCEVQRAAGAQSPDHRARYGELATRMVILAVTPAVLNAISIWLNKKNSGESFEETLSVVGPDGSRKEHKIKYRRNSGKRWVIGSIWSCISTLASIFRATNA